MHIDKKDNVEQQIRGPITAALMAIKYRKEYLKQTESNIFESDNEVFQNLSKFLFPDEDSKLRSDMLTVGTQRANLRTSFKATDNLDAHNKNRAMEFVTAAFNYDAELVAALKTIQLPEFLDNFYKKSGPKFNKIMQSVKAAEIAAEAEAEAEESEQTTQQAASASSGASIQISSDVSQEVTNQGLGAEASSLLLSSNEAEQVEEISLLSTTAVLPTNVAASATTTESLLAPAPAENLTQESVTESPADTAGVNDQAIAQPAATPQVAQAAAVEEEAIQTPAPAVTAEQTIAQTAVPGAVATPPAVEQQPAPTVAASAIAPAQAPAPAAATAAPAQTQAQPQLTAIAREALKTRLDNGLASANGFMGFQYKNADKKLSAKQLENTAKRVKGTSDKNLVDALKDESKSDTTIANLVKKLKM